MICPQSTRVDPGPAPSPTAYDSDADEDVLVESMAHLAYGYRTRRRPVWRVHGVASDLNSDGILDLAVGASAFSFRQDGADMEVGVLSTFNMKRNGDKGAFVYGCDYGTTSTVRLQPRADSRFK